MSQWNTSSDFWMSPAATVPEPATAQAWAKDSDEREPEASSSRVDPSYHALAQNQQSEGQWHTGLDLFSDRDMFPSNAPFAQSGEIPRQSKASKPVGHLSYSYPYSQASLHPQQAVTGTLSSLDAYTPLPQNYFAAPNALSLPGFGDTFPSVPGQHEAQNLGHWSQNQQIPAHPVPQASAAHSQFQPIDTSRPDAFDASSSSLSNDFNFQFNEHSFPDLHGSASLEPPTLQFQAPDLTGVSAADYHNPHLSQNFAMPSTEGYHGYTYDASAVPLGSENIGLAIAGPPQGLLPHDGYSTVSITPGRSEGASSMGKSLSPRTTDSVPHRGRIPPDAKAILEQHFEQNAYPTKEEVEQLAARLGLKPKTVKNWFGNTRQRRPCSGEFLSQCQYSTG